MTVWLPAVSLALACVLALPHRAGAQSAPAQDPQQANQTPAEPPLQTVAEEVVVSASRTEQLLVNAPATVSILTKDAIRRSPATNMGDLLRVVPGVNVSQLSARDVNLTSRGATSTLSTSQLALVDGRTMYLDFFGMVMWDLLPASPHEIRRIEVIRGPASAVWGANAMNGVVNVITLSPRELAEEERTSVVIGAGVFERAVPGRDRSSGASFSVQARHAEAPNDRWSYKVSAGYASQDALPRPAGTIPNAFNTPYPAYANAGTTQPKFDGRVDYDWRNGGRLTLAGGVVGTSGIIHAGLGPFDIADGSWLSYVTARYERGGRRLAFFANVLDADATNVLAREPTGAFLPLAANTRTFDLDAGDVRVIGRRHVLSFGGNLRHNGFDISLAPAGDNRREAGAYLQDEIFLSNHVRWVVGGRIDYSSSLDDATFSPRTAVLVQPTPSQTLRASFNRAFRAPSFINNHFDATVLQEVNLGLISPALSAFVFPVEATGNPDLRAETMTAFEFGYTGVIRDRATVTAAVYWNTIDDAIFFTQTASYTPANPPPTWPAQIPSAALAAIPDPGLPLRFTYLNLGTVTERGFEIGVDGAVTPSLGAFANYSFQATPRTEGFDPREINVPARHRVNLGLTTGIGRFFGNVSVSYASEAYWQDVLDLRFAGATGAYTLVGGGIGANWLRDRLVTSLKVNNLANQTVMQHIFGDIQKRHVRAELQIKL